VPAGIEARGLRLSIWGAPWDASHNGRRGACLNETEPLFALGSCSVGDPLQTGYRPLAFLTLPTRCGAPLSFAARASSWQGGGGLSATATSRDAGGAPVPLAGCSELRFDPDAAGLLSDRKASSSSGFAFRSAGKTPGSPIPERGSARTPAR
jgi:hypothetical protein